eukprot:359163-Chlamydomonas_euryale.AAC.6
MVFCLACNGGACKLVRKRDCTQRVQATHFLRQDDVTQTAAANSNNEDRSVTLPVRCNCSELTNLELLKARFASAFDLSPFTDLGCSDFTLLAAC